VRKPSFILGLIGGILGILACVFLLFSGLNMKVTEVDSTKVMIFAFLGILLSILALVGACIIEKKKTLAGVFMIVGAIANIPCSLYSISADNQITFLLNAVVTILLLISGIMALCVKNNEIKNI